MNPTATALEQLADTVQREATTAPASDSGTLVGLVPGDAPLEARQALALVDLAGRSLPEAAADLGVDKAELRRLLAAGRTALRRARQPLAGGGRCLRARRLLSERMDEVLGARETTLLQVHLDNCPRCTRHEELLAEELAALQARVAQPPSAEVRRAVRATLSLAPAQTPSETPAPAPAAPEPAAAPVRRSQAAAPRPRRGRRLASRTLVLVATVLALAAGVLAGAAVIVGELDSAPAAFSHEAPWAQPGAPQIPPRPIE